MAFKVGDVVRVVLQPPNQNVWMVGVVGYVTEASGRYVTLQAMTIEGAPSGSGAVPVDCLSVENREEWLLAAEYHKKGAERADDPENN